MVFLANTLHGTAKVSHWSTVWIGLDTMEALALAGLGILLVRHDHRARTAATVAATLFGMDAWFDVMLSSGGDFAQALDPGGGVRDTAGGGLCGDRAADRPVVRRVGKSG